MIGDRAALGFLFPTGKPSQQVEKTSVFSLLYVDMSLLVHRTYNPLGYIGITGTGSECLEVVQCLVHRVAVPDELPFICCQVGVLGLDFQEVALFICHGYTLYNIGDSGSVLQIFVLFCYFLSIFPFRSVGL